MHAHDVQPAVGATVPVDSASESQTIGREDFLRMLIAQLENQDPLSPQDPTEMTAQLAQFSSLEQLIAIRQALDGDTVGQPVAPAAGNTLFDVAALIGNDVLARIDHIALADADAVLPELMVEIPFNPDHHEADHVRIQILDEDGGIVRTIEPVERAPGRHVFAWDGKGFDPKLEVQPGLYELRATATYGAESYAIPVLVRGPVTGAAPGFDGQPALMLGDMVVPLAAVVEIRQSQDAP